MSDRIAVINQGSIQQIGNPEEIYEKPSNQFVANFIGEANPIGKCEKLELMEFGNHKQIIKFQ